MENNEGKTDDQLIEDFWTAQGGKPHDPADIWFYGSSLDMLMPVVYKISEYLLVYPEQVHRINDLSVIVRKDILYSRVIEFIKWYNSNGK